MPPTAPGLTFPKCAEDECIFSNSCVPVSAPTCDLGCYVRDPQEPTKCHLLMTGLSGITVHLQTEGDLHHHKQATTSEFSSVKAKETTKVTTTATSSSKTPPPAASNKPVNNFASKQSQTPLSATTIQTLNELYKNRDPDQTEYVSTRTANLLP